MPNRKKALADGGPSIHDEVISRIPYNWKNGLRRDAFSWSKSSVKN
jgi:hypothetical protein